MAQFRNRHRIIDSNGVEAEGISVLDPPPSLLKLVQQDPVADAQWKKWLNNQYEYIGVLTDKANDIFITPSSITENLGGGSVGSVTDVQTLNDGNVYNMAEEGGGFDVDFVFENISSFTGLVTRVQYVGSATHAVEIDIWDYVATSRDQYIEVPHNAALYQYRTIRFPELSQYVNSSNQVTVSIVHTTTPGNVTHDLYVDYVALIGKTT